MRNLVPTDRDSIIVVLVFVIIVFALAWVYKPPAITSPAGMAHAPAATAYGGSCTTYEYSCSGNNLVVNICVEDLYGFFSCTFQTSFSCPPFTTCVEGPSISITTCGQTFQGTSATCVPIILTSTTTLETPYGG